MRISNETFFLLAVCMKRKDPPDTPSTGQIRPHKGRKTSDRGTAHEK